MHGTHAFLSGEWCLQKAAEEARFDRARKMTEVEGRKRYEFLEAMCSSMDAHVRFFERGHEVRGRQDWGGGRQGWGGLGSGLGCRRILSGSLVQQHGQEVAQVPCRF